MGARACLGMPGRPKLPCGPFWEPDVAHEMLAPVCLGMAKTLEMVAHARLGEKQARSALECTAQGAVSTRLFFASLYEFPCVSVLVEVRYVTSK